jgi:hypothetical protein
MESNYEFWKNLTSNPENYRSEKQKAAETIAKKLEDRFPGISNQIEATMFSHQFQSNTGLFLSWISGLWSTNKIPKRSQ